MERTDPACALEKMIQDEQDEGKAACQRMESKLKTLLALLIDPLARMEPAVTQLQNEMATVRAEMERLKTDEQYLTRLRAHYEQLSEQQYEREVLEPLFHSLISIVLIIRLLRRP